jgi:3-oxoacyl-[acyl-carrier protein] reductase
VRRFNQDFVRDLDASGRALSTHRSDEREGSEMNTSDIPPVRTAIVTGAAGDIGAATARRLAADGFQVAAVDLAEAACQSLVGEIEAVGGRALSIGADVSSEPDVEGAVARVASELGPPTVLINNAGIIRDNLLFRLSIDDWDAVMNVNLRGSFLMARAAQKYMVEAGWGRVVNLSSTSALGNRGQANYAAAKAGLQGFTKTLALELGKFGITANAIAPGSIETGMMRATAARLGVDFEELTAAIAARTPVGRTGAPDDIAHAVSFFVSEWASYVSGQVLYVAGGPRC